MSVEKRTIAGWCHYLNDPDVQLTLSEFMAKCLLDLRDNGVLGRLATEHVEGMLGTLDETMAERDQLYGALAARRSTPVQAALNGSRGDGQPGRS